jgi:hypothetical protein
MDTQDTTEENDMYVRKVHMRAWTLD